jgi:hypothetical protein
VEKDIAILIEQHGFTGFHTPVYYRWFDLEKERSDEIAVSDPNPYIRTFEALELLISKLHTAGGVMYIWMWGDESRRQTPIKWGINGWLQSTLKNLTPKRIRAYSNPENIY